jgi:tetratricopeptide (TPR) repeat protein
MEQLSLGLRRVLFLGLVAPTLLVRATEGLAQKSPHSSPAIDSLERRARADSNDAIAHYDLAMSYWTARRYDDSERELRESVKLAPEYAEAYLALASLPVARGEKYWKKIEKEQGGSVVQAAFEAGGRFYRRAFLLNPLVDLRILGKVEERSEIREGNYIIQVWWLRPLTRSLNAIRSAQFQQAFDLLQHVLDDPKAGTDAADVPDAVLWYHGLTAAHLGRYDEAIHDLAVLTGRAVADEQTDPLTAIPLKANDYRYSLATMLYLAGRNDQAAPTFRRALEFDVGLYPAHVQLARMLEAEHRWDEAIRERRAAIDANPDDAVLLNDLSRTLLRAGKIEEAADAIELAMAANPRDPEAPYLAGIVALRLDRRNAARTAFNRFLSLAPSRYAARISEVRDQLALLEAGK